MDTHATRVFCLRCNSLQCPHITAKDVYKTGFKIVDGIQYRAGHCEPLLKEKQV